MWAIVSILLFISRSIFEKKNNKMLGQFISEYGYGES